MFNKNISFFFLGIVAVLVFAGGCKQQEPKNPNVQKIIDDRIEDKFQKIKNACNNDVGRAILMIQEAEAIEDKLPEAFWNNRSLDECLEGYRCLRDNNQATSQVFEAIKQKNAPIETWVKIRSEAKDIFIKAIAINKIKEAK